jgi:hypothetical protein
MQAVKRLRAPVRASFAATLRRSVASSTATTGKTTHFGFQEVDESSKKEMVGDVFRRVADK